MLTFFESASSFFPLFSPEFFFFIFFILRIWIAILFLFWFFFCFAFTFNPYSFSSYIYISCPFAHSFSGFSFLCHKFLCLNISQKRKLTPKIRSHTLLPGYTHTNTEKKKHVSKPTPVTLILQSNLITCTMQHNNNFVKREQWYTNFVVHVNACNEVNCVILHARETRSKMNETNDDDEEKIKIEPNKKTKFVRKIEMKWKGNRLTAESSAYLLQLM